MIANMRTNRLTKSLPKSPLAVAQLGHCSSSGMRAYDVTGHAWTVVDETSFLTHEGILGGA